MAKGFSSGWKVATILGLTVRIHPSWLLIFGLLVFSLGSYLVPMADLTGGGAWWGGEETMQEIIKYQENNPEASREQMVQDLGLSLWPQWQYWAVAVVGSLGLFVCVLAHEMSHSVVARRNGIPVEGITLFIFGGVASLRDEAPTPEVELKVAAAGPLMSVAIAAVCWVGYAFARGPGPEQASTLLFYFAFVNSLLVGFNLVPGFPLDGGRVLRAIIWKVTGSLHRATSLTARIGRGFGAVLIGFGIFEAVALWITTQQFSFGPLWLVFIGLFLRYAAQAGYRQVALREALSGMTVRDILQEEVVSVDPEMAVDRLVDEYFYKYRFRSFPVLEGDRLEGMIGLKDVQGVPRAEWESTKVRDAMHQVAEENLVRADDDLVGVFRKMMSEDKGHLPVVEGGQLRGIVTRHDIMNLLQIKSDLGGEIGAGGAAPQEGR